MEGSTIATKTIAEKLERLVPGWRRKQGWHEETWAETEKDKSCEAFDLCIAEVEALVQEIATAAAGPPSAV